ncbi:MAG: hypothetical protein M1814_001249 [Vezdaea aestivalis]|nr:MAG: hypothetical protein M1814_001249 [Vezdaea aestivalis]
MAPNLQQCLRLIDEAHANDPNTVTMHGGAVPYELHYANLMTSYLQKLSTTPSETLQIAIRAQHLRRWEVPRSSYPMTKAGYFSWRTGLKKRQATQAAEICKQCGYDDEASERVAALIRKEDLKKDEETQMLEDAACLVFLQDQFEEFEKEHNEEKIIGILKKTWGKMSAQAHAEALKIDMNSRATELVEKALS